MVVYEPYIHSNFAKWLFTHDGNNDGYSWKKMLLCCFAFFLMPCDGPLGISKSFFFSGDTLT